jgi:hypothetical protein
MNTKQPFDSVLKHMGLLLESLHNVDSPFEFAITLVSATAQIYNADIATLFRVTPSKTELVAEAGFDLRGEQLKATATYNLPWSAKSEKDMPRGGITPWVAVSAKPLFIKSAEELLKHPAHRGAWDAELHPEGPRKTFGCLYAVPLRVASKEGASAQDSVLGVYKIERRQDNREGIFTEQQIREFDLAAKQLTLVIILYETAMQRVLSDAQHAVAGRLADAISQLDIMRNYLQDQRVVTESKEINESRKILDRVKDDTNRVFSWLRQALTTYTNPLGKEDRQLRQFIEDTIAARENQRTRVTFSIPEADETINLEMTVAQSWDLHTLLLSLLNNAVKHSGEPETVHLNAES